MKGVSRFVSYAFTILLGFIVLSVFSILIFGYYDQVLKSDIESGLKQIAIQTVNGIIELYGLAEEYETIPENFSLILISSIDLNYPDQVSGRSFEIELISSPGIWSTVTNVSIGGEDAETIEETTSGSKIIVKTTQRPYVSYEYDVPNIPINLQGKFRSGGNDVLKLVRYNFNGTVEDRILLGESDIIVGINSIEN